MKNNILLALIILVSSIGTYLVQIMIFERAPDTVFYLLQDLAFIPIQVVIVTLVFNRLLNSREKKQKIKKINVIITTFFIEAGSDLIDRLSTFDTSFDTFRRTIDVADLSGNMAQMRKRVKAYDCGIDAETGDLYALKSSLIEKKGFLLSMLENDNLLEHDSFTDMLWAIFHITDELQSRADLAELPPTDFKHLSLDLVRAYKLLMLEWLDFIRYLNKDYPYLFSLAVRKNPFIDNRDVRIMK